MNSILPCSIIVKDDRIFIDYSVCRIFTDSNQQNTLPFNNLFF